MNRTSAARRIMALIFFTFIGSAIFIVLRLIFTPSEVSPWEPAVRTRSDYVYMLVLCLFGTFAMLIPGYLRQRVSLNIPTGMMIVYAIFVYCAIYLGEIRNFYYLVPHWDTVLHTFSGFALGALGFSVVSLLNRSDSIAITLSPIFVALFSFCFAMTLDVIWEIIEFSADFFADTNMQKYALESGEALVGQAALLDTMKDLVVDGIGAFIISGIGYISLRYEKGWLERFQVKRM